MAFIRNKVTASGRALKNRSDDEQDQESAADVIKSLLQQPSDLDTIMPQRKWQTEYEKASVDVMIHTMMESHLDSIQVAMDRIANTREAVKSMEEDFEKIFERLRGTQQIKQQLAKLRQEYGRYRQYRTALEVSVQLMNVNESIDKIRQLIHEDKLLDAHVRLSDLDRSREDLIVSICSLGTAQTAPSQSEVGYIFAYFHGIEDVYEVLAKKVWLTISRAVNVVRQQPSVLVSALRIIEREEIADRIAYQRTGEELAKKAVRPRAWRQRCMLLLEKAVTDRIEGCQVEEREREKMWLVRHLEMMRLNVVEDFVLIKSALLQCFPPSYKIDTFLCRAYHVQIAEHIRQFAEEDAQLLTEENVTLLQWLEEYDSPACLRDPRISLTIEELGGPLLPDRLITQLRDKYVKGTVGQITTWMANALAHEVDDWNADKGTEKRHIGTANQACFTSITQTIVQIIEQNVRIAERVKCRQSVFERALQCLSDFFGSYNSALVTYKQQNFAQRLNLAHYSDHVFAVANNALDFQEVIDRWLDPTEGTAGVSKDAVIARLHECRSGCRFLRNNAVKTMLEAPFEDLKPHLPQLGTPAWMRRQARPIDILCPTFIDYAEDYRHALVEVNYVYCMNYVQKYAMSQLLIALMERRIKCVNDEERRLVATRIDEDFQRTLKTCFERLCPESVAEHEKNYEVLRLVRDLMSSSNDMLGMVVPNMLRFGGASEQQVCRIADVRGDLKLDFANPSRLDGPKLMLDVNTEQWQAAVKPSDRANIFDELPYK